MAMTFANPKVVLLGEDKASKVFQKAVRDMEGVSKSFAKVGSTLTKSITLPAFAGAAASVKMAVDFNAALASVASLMPGESERVRQMGQQIQELAIETGADTIELTTTLKNLISSLGAAGDPVKKMTAVTKAAAATASDSSDALGLLTAVTKAYGDTSEEAFEKVSNIAVLAERVGDAPFVDMANNIGKVAAKSAALGVSYEEMFGVLSAYGTTLGSVSDVSTQFSAILNSFVKPTKELTAVSKKYGHESATSMLQTLGFVETMNLLREETKGSIPVIGKMFGSAKAMNQLMPLLTDNFEVYNDTVEQLKNASGSVDEAIREQTEGLNKTGFQFNQLKQRVKVLGQQLGERLLPLFGKILDKLSPLIDRLRAMDDQTIARWGKFIAAAAAIGPAFTAMSKVWGIGAKLATLLSGSGGIATALTALTSPVGIAVAAFASVAAAAIYFREELEPVWDALRGIGATLKDQFVATVAGATEGMDTSGTSARNLVSDLAPLLATFAKLQGSFLALPIKYVIWSFGNVIKIFRVVATVVENAHKIFKAMWGFMSVWLEKKINEVPFLSAIRDGLKSVWEIATKAWDKITGLLKMFGGVGGKIISKLTGVSIEGVDDLVNYLENRTLEISPANIDPGYVAPWMQGQQTTLNTEQQTRVQIDFSNLPEGTTVTQKGAAPVQMSSNTGPLLTGAL